MSLVDPILVPIRLDSEKLIKDIKAMSARITGDPVQAIVEYKSDITKVVADIKGLISKDYGAVIKLKLDKSGAVQDLQTFAKSTPKVETKLTISTFSASKELEAFRDSNASLKVAVTAKDLEISTNIEKTKTTLSKLFSDYGELNIRTTLDPTQIKAVMSGFRSENNKVSVEVDANLSKAANQILKFRGSSKTHVIQVGADTSEAMSRIAKLKAGSSSLGSSFGADTSAATKKIQELVGKYADLEIKVKADVTLVKSSLSALNTEHKNLASTLSLDTEGAKKGLAVLAAKYRKLPVGLSMDLSDPSQALKGLGSKFAELVIDIKADITQAANKLQTLFDKFDSLTIPVKADILSVKGSLSQLFASYKNLTSTLSLDSEGAKKGLAILAAKYRKLPIALSMDLSDPSQALKGLGSKFAELVIDIKADIPQAANKLQTLFDKFDSLTIPVKADILSAKGSLSQLFASYKTLASTLSLDTDGAKKGLAFLAAKYRKLPIALSMDLSDPSQALKGLGSKFAELAINVKADITQAANKLQTLFDKFETLSIPIKADILSAKGSLSQLFASYKNLSSTLSLDTDGAKKGLAFLAAKYRKLSTVLSIDSAAASSNLKSLGAKFSDFGSTLTVDTSTTSAKLKTLFDKFDQLDFKLKSDLAPIRQTLGALFGDYKYLKSVFQIDTYASTKTLYDLFSKFAKLSIAVSVDIKQALQSLADFRQKFKTLSVSIALDSEKADRSLKGMVARFAEMTIAIKADVVSARATLTKLFADFGKLVISTSANTEKAGGSLAAVHRKYKTLRLDVTADPAKVAERLEALSGRAGALKLKADLDVSAAAAKIEKIVAQTDRINSQIVLDDMQAQSKIAKLESTAKAIDMRVNLDTNVAQARIAKLGAQQQKIEIETELKKPNLGFLKGLGSLAANLFQSGFQVVTQLIQGALAGIGGFLKESIKVGNEVDSIIRRGSGLAGGGEDVYTKIRENAIRVGAQPNVLVSTKDVALATELYLKAGRQIDVAIAAQKGVAEISTLTGEKATSIASNLLDYQSKFALNAKEQNRASELFAGLLTSAKLTSKDAAFAAKYLVPDGNSLKDLENSTKQLALMASSGIRGSTAATSIGAAMRNLPKIMEELGVSRTFEDGRVKSSLQLMLESRKALLEYQRVNGELKTKDLALNAKDGFGVNGGRAMLQFMQQSDKQIEETIAKIDNASTKMAVISKEAMKSNAVGGIAVQNSLEALQVRTAGALAPALNAIQLGVSNVLNGLTNSPIWAKVGTLTASITDSVNSPRLQGAFAKVGEWLSMGILKGVQAVDTFFKYLANPPSLPWLDKLRIGLSDIFGGAFRFINQFTSSIAGAGFFGALSDTFTSLGSIVGSMFKELGSVVQSVYSTEGASEFFRGIGDAAKGVGSLAIPLIRLVGEGIKVLAPSLGTLLGLVGKALSLVGNLATVLTPAVDFIVSGLAIGITPALKGILYVLTNIVASPISILVNGLTLVKDVVWVLSTGFTKTGDAAYTFLTRMNDRLNAVYVNIGSYFSNIGKWFAGTLAAIGSGLDSLNTKVGAVLTGMGSLVVNLFRTTMTQFDGVGKAIAQIYKGAYDASRSALVAVVGLVDWAAKSTRSLFSGVGSAIGSAMATAATPAKAALSYLVSLAKWAVSSIKSLFSGAGSSIGSAFSGAYKGAQTAFSNIIKLAQWAVSSVRSVFSGIGTSISNAFSGVASAIQRAFSPIYGIVANVRSAVNGLTSSVQNAINGLSRIPNISLPKFAEGGVIGKGRSTSDDQLILAQRGEGIITHKGMDVLGADRLALLNAGIKAFAMGGVVGGSAKPIKAGGFDFSLDFSKIFDNFHTVIKTQIGLLIAAIKSSGSSLSKSIATMPATLTPALKSVATKPETLTPALKSIAAVGVVKPTTQGIDLNAVFKGSNWAPAGKSLQGPNESIFEAAGYSTSLIRTLKAFEQFSGTTYKDSEGIDTIGFGSARTSGDPKVLAALAKGRVSVAEANTLMLNHLRKENPIAYIKSKFKSIKSFSEGQIAALVSLYYNGGPGIIDSLARKASTIPQIAAALPTHWINAGTGSEQGLRNRRAVETKLFNAVGKATQGTVPTIAPSNVAPQKATLAYLEAVRLGMDPKITPALAAELNRLSPGAVVGGSTQSRLDVIGVSNVKPFVRVTRTGQKDKNGLEILKTDLVKNGVVIDTMFATSGQSYVQKFQVAGQAGQLGAGSMAPLPEGIYKLGEVSKTAGSFGNGLGNTYIDVDGNFGAGRSAIGIHRDANISVSPGSAGCLVFNNQAEIDKMANWVTSVGAKTIVTDWGLGSIKTTGQGVATLKPNPQIIAGLIQSVTGAAPDIVGGTMAVLAPPIVDSINAGLNLDGAILAAPILSDLATASESINTGSAPALSDLGLAVDDFAGSTEDLFKATQGLASGVSDLVKGIPEVLKVGSFYKDGSADNGGFYRPLVSTSSAVRPSLTPSFTQNTFSGSSSRAPLEIKLSLQGGKDYGANQAMGSQGRTYDGIQSAIGQIEATFNSEGFQRDLLERLIQAFRGDDRLRQRAGF